MTTETKNNHTGEAAQKPRESKAPEKYVFPQEVTEHLEAIKTYCDSHRPDIHCLLILGHEYPSGDDVAVEINYTASGSDFILTHLHKVAGEQLAKRMIRSLLSALVKETEDDPGVSK